MVLRALDGQLLGKRPIPPLDQRMATIGRTVLVWETVDGNAADGKHADGAGVKQVVSLRDIWTSEVKWSYAFIPGARAAVVADETVGVLEPTGRFVLVRIADGHRIAEHQLEPEEHLSAIGLLRSADQYLLITNSPPENVDANFNSQPPGSNIPMISGRVYAFGRVGGEKRWPRPAVVQQQGLVLTQPCELPLLFFLSSRTKASPGGHSEPKSVVQVIDKRNGREWFKKDDLPQVIGKFTLSGDHETNTVTLQLSSNTFTFQLTDLPLPPLVEAPPKPKPGFLNGLGGAILKSIERQGPPVRGLRPAGNGREADGEVDDD